MCLCIPPAWEKPTGFSGSVDLRGTTALMGVGAPPLGEVQTQESLESNKGNPAPDTLQASASLSLRKGLPGTFSMSDHRLLWASAKPSVLCHAKSPSTL